MYGAFQGGSAAEESWQRLVLGGGGMVDGSVWCLCSI